VISAVKRYSFLDTLSTVSTSVLIAIPVFWLGLMLQILFGVKFRGTFLGLPISGVTDGWKSYVLPSITLASAFAAVTARLTRTTMLEVMRQDLRPHRNGQGPLPAGGGVSSTRCATP